MYLKFTYGNDITTTKNVDLSRPISKKKVQGGQRNKKRSTTAGQMTKTDGSEHVKNGFDTNGFEMLC